jgi:nitroreductase
MLDAIRTRTSVRTYDPRPLEPAARAEVLAVLQQAGGGPFGGVPRFALIDRDAARADEKVRLGTYGFVQGHPCFVAGCIARGPRAEVDYGHAFQGVVLHLTRLGLGTCWLGGTFSRGEFARVLRPGAGEVIPAVSPLGYAAARRGLVERVVRFGARADDRLPWSTLFFDGSSRVPLSREAAGDDADLLEAVRRGPSASNRQPWRVVREGRAFHVFLERTPGYYGRLLPGVDLQALDLGIALRHVQEASQALGRPGAWQLDPPPWPAPGWEFGATWRLV